MMKASTIVCAIDMSAASRQSLPLAAKMAANMGAKLVLVHPVHFHNWYIYSVMTYSPKHEAAAIAGRVRRFVRDVMNLTPEVRWELRVEAGEPATVIEAAARETGADLVISARRRGRLEVLKSTVQPEPAAESVRTPEPDLSFRPVVTAAESHQGASL